MQRPASQISPINVTRHAQLAAHGWTGLSHLPCSQPRRADADSAQSCTTDMVDSIAAQRSSLIAPYATILKKLKVMTASALLHWHRAQPGVFLCVPPETVAGIRNPGSSLK
ncbi:hypothetical protein [Stenotrophomonas maltophilia]